MITQALHKSPSGHIRPFSPTRDLGALAALIEEAFREELAITRSSIVRDMRQMALLGPLAWAARPVMPFFTGYVWIEDGQLVGNVSLSRESEQASTWVLSNVAVKTEFRGRGIAGQLLDAAIAHVRQHRGRRILLQVRADNQVALALYRHRGFVSFDTLHELNLVASNWPLILGSRDAPLRGVRARDSAKLYELVRASTRPEAWLRRPLCASHFRRGLKWWFAQGLQLALSGQQVFELVAEQQGELVAYGSIKAYLFQGPDELALHVLPSQRGRWELPLVEGLINLAQGMPRYDIRAYVSVSHPEGIGALRRVGFETLRILEQMSLELA